MEKGFRTPARRVLREPGGASVSASIRIRDATLRILTALTRGAFRSGANRCFGYTPDASQRVARAGDSVRPSLGESLLCLDSHAGRAVHAAPGLSACHPAPLERRVSYDTSSTQQASMVSLHAWHRPQQWKQDMTFAGGRQGQCVSSVTSWMNSGTILG